MCCLMSSDVSWHIRDKLWPMPRTSTSTLTQLPNYGCFWKQLGPFVVRALNKTFEDGEHPSYISKPPSAHPTPSPWSLGSSVRPSATKEDFLANSLLQRCTPLHPPRHFCTLYFTNGESNHDLVISFTQGMFHAFQRGATWPSLKHFGQNKTTR